MLADLRLGGPNALGFAKRLIYEVPEMEQQEAFAWAADLSGQLFRGEEAAAGMKAFLKREKPPWASAGDDDGASGRVFPVYRATEGLSHRQIRAIVEANLAEIGITAPVRVTPNSDFYGEYWCAGAEWGAQPDTGGPTRPCGASADIGIVDYGHRPTPDVYFSSALASGGVWNSSNYANPEFDAKLSEYRRAIDVDGQKTAVGAIQKILWEDVPAVYPYFYNFLSGHDSSITGVRTTALGHTIVSGASRTG